MAYITGSASNISDLMSALNSALTSNGWAYGSGNFTKGTMSFAIASVSNHLTIRSNVGGGPDTIKGCDGTMSLGAIGASALQYPMNYYIHIHTSPDEVYLFVNESSDRWSWLAFGQSDVAGISGPGDWYAANITGSNNSFTTASIGIDFSTQYYQRNWGLFTECRHGNADNSVQPYNSTVYHGLDGFKWSQMGEDYDNQTISSPVFWSWSPVIAAALQPITPLLKAQPNTWNSQAVLVRVQAYIKRASNKFSLVLDLGHSRYLRNDNYNDGDIITIGSDQWKVYPFLKKNITNRNGVQNSTHSGTFALAVRYDGP